MNCKLATLIILTCLSASIGIASDPVAQDNTITIYLPREVEIKGSVPTLEQVSIIRGASELVDKAEKIQLGRLVKPGQSLTISRAVLLGRLASNGITSSNVKLTGAEEIVIRQRGSEISGNDFLLLAKAYLEKNPPSNSICKSEQLRMPAEMQLKGTAEDIQFVPRLVNISTPGLAKIEIAVFADGVKAGVRDVTFRLKYSGHKYVALVDVPAGGMITADNVKIEKTENSYPPANEIINPYGLIAKRSISAKAEIKPNMIGPAEPPVVFKRNQSVVIKIQKFGLLVTAMGKALEDGKVGQYVKVQNIDSSRIIVAKVNGDGTVEPIF